MKRFILSIGSVFLAAMLMSQTVDTKAIPKTIQVTGVAEMEIVPDEIHVLITLKEYERKGKGKADIKTITNEFLAGVKKAGIADSLVKLATMGGNNGMQWWKKKQQKKN